MAVPNGVETVLQFLRKNGLSEAESALRQDIIEKNMYDDDLASFDYEKFFFPMVPPPPPVRLRPSETPAAVVDFFESSSASSEDRFLSIGSATSRVSSSGTLFFTLFLQNLKSSAFVLIGDHCASMQNLTVRS